MNKPLIVAKLIDSEYPEKHYLTVNDEYIASTWGTVHIVEYSETVGELSVSIDHAGQLHMTHFWCDEVRFYPVGTDIGDTMEHLKNSVQPLSVQKKPGAA